MTDENHQHIDAINSIIEKITDEATFADGAMRQFLALKDEVESQESTIKYLRRNNEEDKDKIGDLNSKISSLEGEVEALQTERDSFHQRMSELHDREMQCTANEIRMECANARVVDHQSMVGLIFRNTELRKRSFGEEMNYQPGCVEIRDEFGNIKQYAEQAGHVPVPVKKEQIESEE